MEMSRGTYLIYLINTNWIKKKKKEKGKETNK